MFIVKGSLHFILNYYNICNYFHLKYYYYYEKRTNFQLEICENTAKEEQKTKGVIIHEHGSCF